MEDTGQQHLKCWGKKEQSHPTLAAEMSIPTATTGSPNSACKTQNIYNLFLLPSAALVPTRDLGNLSIIIIQLTPQQAHISCSLYNADMPKSKIMCTISKQYQFSWLKATTMPNLSLKTLLPTVIIG